MIKSMTGYGRAEETVEGCTITVELRSVNNRYLDCNVRIPRLYLFAEEAIKSRVQGTISRGKVDVFVTLDHTGAEKVQVSVNRAAADGYYTALKELAGAYGLADDISVSLLSRFPDVLLAEKAEEDVEQTAKDICSVLDCQAHGAGGPGARHADRRHLWPPHPRRAHHGQRPPGALRPSARDHRRTGGGREP